VIAADLARYKLGAEILVFGALAASGAYGAHLVLDHAREAGRAEVRAEWDRASAAAEKAARAQTESWHAQRDAAVTEGAKREETIRSLAATSAAAAGGLRDAVAKIDGAVPDYSADALRALTSTYGQLLEECNGRRSEVAEEAERLNSEKRTMIEAWPAASSAWETEIR
jgi:vacuolar-type H+-ATPase subunit I/STV1